MKQQSVLAASSTGFNHWWTFEEDALPGVGKYYANVNAYGNLIVQADDDMAVPHKGIELDFRRTYNSLSTHDYFGTDGSQISNYGGGWTNTIDAHIALSTDLQTMSVYDIDGARYDYTADGQGNWIPPAGQFASLVYDTSDPNNPLYDWTKTSGTTYQFWPTVSPISPIHKGRSGRLVAIFGRNHNTSLNLVYSWNPDDSNPVNLTEIDVHEDGVSSAASAKLYFTKINVEVSNNNFVNERVLSSLVRPDNSTINYYYAVKGGALAEVDKPVNNTQLAHCPIGHNSGPACLPETYSYPDYTYQMNSANGPRAAIAGPGGSDGGYTTFAFDGTSGAIRYIDHVGVVNFTPNDGTGQLLQPTAITPNQDFMYRQDAFTPGSGTSTWSDTDGHSVVYYYNSVGSVVERQENTGSQMLTTYQVWDSTSNNLTSTTDANNKVTYYFYDQSGNAIEVAKPSVSNSDGNPPNFYPTELYSYDSYNNVTAFCDAHFTHTQGLDYQGSAPNQSDSLCPSVPAGATILTYANQGANSYEPDGELSTITTPMGYRRVFTYATMNQLVGDNGNSQGNTIDFGLPTAITASQAISQSDGTLRTPLQTFSYDVYGNVKSHGTGYGNTCSNVFGGGGADATFYWYDSMGRAKKEEDADCVVYSRSFYLDGSLETTQSPSQAADNISSTYTYNADADEIGETHYHGCVVGYPQDCARGGLTQKWYDGADRLVEVQQPQNPYGEYYPFPWETRYIYDLSKQGAKYNVTLGNDSSLQAYGNLYETLEYLPGIIWNSFSQPSTGSWIATKGTTYDGIDREIAKYDLGMYSSAQNKYVYDQGCAPGNLCSKTDALGEKTTWSYDDVGRMTAVNFSDNTYRNYVYDSDARITSVLSSIFGTLSKSYDADGRLYKIVEPTLSGLTASSTLTFSYYADGLRSTLSVAVNNGPTWSPLFGYSYRTDDLLQTNAVTWPNVNSPYRFTYSNAGRKTASTNPLTGVTYTGGGGTWGGESIAYDAAGRVSSWVGSTPNAYRTGVTYDDEGSIVYETGGPYMGPGGCTVSCTITNAYNARGELWATQYGINSPVYTSQSGCSSKQLPQANFSMANGYAVGAIIGYCYGYGPANFNTVDDVPLGTVGIGGRSSYTYDQLGRQSTVSQTASGNPGCAGTLQRSYDIENHLVGLVFSNYDFTPAGGGCQQGYQGPSGTAVYGWGPNGHPILITWNSPPLPPSATLHWDGDTLLFVTDNNGNVLQVKAGPNADDLLPNNGGIFVYDRNPSGIITGGHNAVYNPNSGWKTADDPYQQAWDQSVAQQGPILEPRPDGVWDMLGVIQGVRNHDPQTGTWTTPDEFPGEIHDPMSQKSYMWNRNNPISYSDPTGYCSAPSGSGTRVCIDAFIREKATVGGPWALRGDNRQTSGNMSPDRYRLRVNVNFTTHTASAQIANSHWANSGKDAGAGHLLKFEATWLSKNTVSITAAASCGPCNAASDRMGATIRIDSLVLQLGSDGNIHVLGGSHSGYPAFEIYQYDDKSHTRLVNNGDGGGSPFDLTKEGPFDTKEHQL